MTLQDLRAKAEAAMKRSLASWYGVAWLEHVGVDHETDAAHIAAWGPNVALAALAVIECVPDLLDWMERYRGGDGSLHSEEFYVRSETARRALSAFYAAISEGEK